jgi:ppGpp synthetase/RelA/SpoT-type nucleotidyltranferase
MQTGPFKITDTQVVEYLSANRAKYEALLDEVVKLAKIVAEHSGTTGRVYRIYTRADKQTGNIFKDVWKIVEKANSLRSTNQQFQISHLGDIIGATIVVVYPSDIEVVRKIIDEKINIRQFKSHANTSATRERPEFFGEEKRSGGYYAHHYQLEVDNNLMRPQLLNARCELQIKTVLHDAWGAKTHDLTYKRAGALDTRMSRQVEVLGDVLAGIDQQSELLRHIIEGRWALDNRKANTAKGDLLKRTLKYDDETTQDRYLEIRSKIIDSKNSLSNKPTQDQQLQEMISALDQFGKEVVMTIPFVSYFVC